ncbi:uncharacterized protein [Palaemon carinicauda]|uniref:uncharacterized protein n=1 Tax=Palaemon carinicauda TaxID=392227 RepID=UPI0035B678CC
MYEMHRFFLYFGCFALLAPPAVKGVRMTSPTGSKYVLEGSNVTLNCKFDLEGDELYSLLWWRDGSVLMRYTSHQASYISLATPRLRAGRKSAQPKTLWSSILLAILP